MGADSYYAPIEVVTTTPTCSLCGWRGDWLPCDRNDRRAVRAFYAHFHASCIIQASLGEYEDYSDVDYDGPLASRARQIIETRRAVGCVRCPDRSTPWCEHHQPTPVGVLAGMWPEADWSRPVPEWAR